MAAHRPRLISGDGRSHAAVAVVLHGNAGGIRLLFIERSEREGDPWSGHLAFPGGRVETTDRGPRAAAERETIEEIGLDLRPAEYLGRLDDITGATLPVLVSGFVYSVAHPGRLEPNPEVREAFWIPVDDLLDSKRHVQYSFRYNGTERLHPAIDLLGPERPLLWGITYRFVVQFLQLTGCAILRTPGR